MKTFLHLIVFALSLTLCGTRAGAAEMDSLSFVELSGEQMEETAPATLGMLAGREALIAFWRSDFASCLREMTILPQIAEDNPSLTIVLISLQGAEYTRKYLHAMPDNIHVLVAKDDGKEVLKAFGNETRAMPFSVVLHADGSVCERRYGLLGTDIVKEWAKTC